jgi:hypothetical protein
MARSIARSGANAVTGAKPLRPTRPAVLNWFKRFNDGRSYPEQVNSFLFRAPPGVERAYTRTTLPTVRRKLMDSWASYCGVGNGDFSVGFRGDAGDDFAHRQRLAKPIGVIALVGQNLSGPGHRGQHQRRALEVTHLPFAQQHDEQSAVAVADGVKLGCRFPPMFDPGFSSRTDPA